MQEQPHALLPIVRTIFSFSGLTVLVVIVILDVSSVSELRGTQNLQVSVQFLKFKKHSDCLSQTVHV